jgi:hypothetical protein
MQMTVTNLTSNQLNYPDYYIGYPGVPPVTSAVGGNLVNPVPYPFDWFLFTANGIGTPNGTPGTTYEVTLPVHEQDLGWRHPNFSPQKVEQLWNILIQAGTVSVSFAAETAHANFGDMGDALIHQC